MRLYAGFITYGNQTAKYLPYFLPSLTSQTFNDFKILAVDNSKNEDNENARYIKNNFPEIDFKWAGKNLGFAKAFNLMIGQAAEDGAEYFLALNPDMVFEPEMASRLLDAMTADDKIAAVQPKILKWDFAQNMKTTVVDSYGVICDRRFRFRDERQGEIDDLKEIFLKEIFGFTGAAILLNLKALSDVAFANGDSLEYFDELMFMYKEDCDLSLRLRLAGWKIVLAPAALAYHNRGAARLGDSIWRIFQNRLGKKRDIKIWSFRGQCLIVLKYGLLPFSARTKFLIWWYELEIMAFTILFEQYLLKELFVIFRARKQIVARKRQLKIRSDLAELESLMR